MIPVAERQCRSKSCVTIRRIHAVSVRPCFANRVPASHVASKFHVHRIERVQLKKSRVVRRPSKLKPKREAELEGGTRQKSATRV